MKILIETSIYRDLKKINNMTVNAEVNKVFFTVKEAVKPKDIPELRKLEGYKKDIYYRIKIKRYRIGVTIEADLVTFARCMLRKDFYKFFP